MKDLVLVLALLVACGGSSIEIPEAQSFEAYFRAPQARNWCCDGTRAGVPVLGCGFLDKPTEFATCYCAGVVGTDGTCEDSKVFTRGTMCTSDDRVCW